MSALENKVHPSPFHIHTYLELMAVNLLFVYFHLHRSLVFTLHLHNTILLWGGEQLQCDNEALAESRYQSTSQGWVEGVAGKLTMEHIGTPYNAN